VNPRAPTTAVIFDFYGTLGETADWDSTWLPDLLAERGVTFDVEVFRRWGSDAWDGTEHTEHSVSEEAYDAWMRARWRSMLVELGTPEGDLDDVIAQILSKRAEWRMALYPETVDVLTELRGRGLRVGLCSNWDWDLDRHLDMLGLLPLLDARVSSAWVGARKPHPRIFEAAVDAVGAQPLQVVFVGDNWVADVEGARNAGLRAVHVWRYEDSPDWLPIPRDDEDVRQIADLRELLPLV
jgi:putative hydrolase of the HAD superfamily